MSIAILTICILLQSIPNVAQAPYEGIVAVGKHECIWGGFEITQQEYELLCRTVYCEAGNQDIETQKMVALTILNRLQSDKFADTISGVVYAKGAYAVTNWSEFEDKVWTEDAQKAVDCALQENKHPEDMYYFRTKHYHKFGKNYTQSGDLYFSTEN